jgi:mono/diheme cytochrome c family protein
MRNVLKTGFALIIIGAFAGCYYDKEELVYPTNTGSTCDTTNVKYSVEVTNILSTNCYSCHGGNAAGGSGIKLGTYADFKIWAQSGIVLEAITHGPNASHMPKGGTKLSDCNIAVIRTWIRNGAQNN